MPDFDPARRSLIAKRAALTRWANCEDRSAATRAAREARWRQYEAQVDPEGLLTPAERRKRARSAELAHMTGMTLKQTGKSAPERKIPPPPI